MISLGFLGNESLMGAEQNGNKSDENEMAKCQ
jgi:hypothetical protein